MKLSLRPSRRMLLWLIPLALLLAILASRGPADALWLNAPGWSRARMVGSTRIEEAVPVALDDAGRIYLFVWPSDAGPRIVALSRAAETLWTQTLDMPGAQVNAPRLVWDGRALMLFWIGDQRLFAARIDSSGAVADPPAVLSGAAAVGSYAVASDTRGRLAVWFGGSRQAPGLYALPTGELGGPAALVDQAGFQPVLRFDGAGALHAIWARDSPSEQRATDVYYAPYPGGDFRPEQSALVVRIVGRRVGIDLTGPWFGLDQERGYLIWTASVASGLQAGASYTQYVSFPLNEPSQVSEIGALGVPDDADLAYEAPSGGGMEAGLRVLPAAGSSGGTSSLAAAATNPVFAPELAVVFENQVAYKHNQTVNQVGSLFLRAGAPAGYQLLSFGPSGSFTPALTSDRSRYLYATWRQLQPPGFGVYFASTAPDMQQALGGLTVSDVGRVTVDTIFGMVTGAIFAPLLAILWLIAPLMVLGVTWFVRRGAERATHWGVLLSLALALAAYWVTKLISFEGNLDYVPFSEWIPVIPSWLALPLRIAVPALIAVAALRIAWRYTYGAERRSALLFVLAYAGVDSLLTAAIYGGLLLNIFGPH
jgi:hypothetical protein